MHKRRFVALCTSVLLIVSGLVFVLVLPNLLKFMVKKNLVLIPDSYNYKLWEHFPELIPMDIYFLNWTNPEDIYNKNVKPKFEEVGPYRFVQDLQKSDVVWNQNGTITYRQKKYFYYKQEGKNRDLQEKVTTPNPSALSLAHAARNWNYLVRKGLSLTLRKIAPTISVTRTVDELLFKGYPDTITKMGKTFPFFAGSEVPSLDRFGWFYMMNGTSYLEKPYNIGTGKNSDDFGKLYSWNYWTKNPYFNDTCAKLEGTMGEKFNLFQVDLIKMFSPDLCRPITLQYVGESEVDGIMGRKYVVGDHTLDNGTIYPENKCFCSGDCIPSGLFNISSCRYGSPVFISLPHFYKADSYYGSLVEGCNPKKEKHEFYVIVEPHTGLPLEFRGRLQMNLKMHSISDMGLYENVPEVFLPVMWFDQGIKMPSVGISSIRKLLAARIVCITIGALSISAGLIFLFHGFVIQKINVLRQEENVPLKREKRVKIVNERPETSRNRPFH